MARPGRKTKSEAEQLELDLVTWGFIRQAKAELERAAESRLQLRRVYLGVPNGRYSALFCTRSAKYGRFSLGSYAA